MTTEPPLPGEQAQRLSTKAVVEINAILRGRRERVAEARAAERTHAPAQSAEVDPPSGR